MAPAMRRATIAIAVMTKVAPRSSRRRPRPIRRRLLMACTYELGVESWMTFVDEMVDGVMTLRPGNSGKSGLWA